MLHIREITERQMLGSNRPQSWFCFLDLLLNWLLVIYGGGKKEVLKCLYFSTLSACWIHAWDLILSPVSNGTIIQRV